MSARTEHRRGFTLVELMVAGAVGIIIITAAMAAFDLQAQFARNTERLLSTQASAGLGLTMMQRDLENAGLRFRGGAQLDGGVVYAMVVRPYDNLGTGVTQLRNDLAGTTIPAVSPPAAGFVPGTDAFEILMGPAQANATRLAAQVQTVTSPGPVNLRTVRIAPNPFHDNELTAAGSQAPLLMFWNDDFHCMGRVVPPMTGVFGGPNALATVQTVDLDLAPAGTAWPAIPCPTTGMQVEVLQQRRRYFVYQTADAAGQPARIGLHMQTNPGCDPLTTGVPCTSDLLTPPLMVAEGVDDLQVAWRILDNFGPGTGGWCQANTTDASCGFELANAAWTPVTVQRASAIYGAQVWVSSRGQEPFVRLGEPILPILNHVPGATDNLVRSIMQTSVLFRNSVTP